MFLGFLWQSCEYSYHLLVFVHQRTLKGNLLLLLAFFMVCHNRCMTGPSMGVNIKPTVINVTVKFIVFLAYIRHVGLHQYRFFFDVRMGQWPGV